MLTQARLLSWSFLFFILFGQLAYAQPTGVDALLRAIQIRENDIAIELLKTYPKEKINYPVSRSGGTFLHIAVQQYSQRKNEGALRLIDALVAKGIDVNRRDDRNRSAVFYVRNYTGSLEILQKLLSHGANINQRDQSGKTVLHVYAEQGSLELIRFLQGKGLDINIADNRGVTPLMDATRRGKMEIIDLLIRNGADTKMVDKQQNTLLHYAARSRNFRILDKMMDLGLPINAKNNRNQTALSILADSRKWSAVRVLLERGADPNVPMRRNQTVALYLLMNPQYGMSHLVSKDKIDVNICSRSRMTPIMDAVNRLNMDAVKKLIEMGADINKRCEKGYAVVPLLAGRDPSRNVRVLSMLEFVLKNGADVNASMYRAGMTGIMIAAQRGYKPTVELLLKAGADLKGSANMSLLGYTLNSKRYEIAAMLLKAGAPIDYNQSIFWVAIRRLAQTIEMDEQSGKTSQHAELFTRLFDGNPVVDMKQRSGRYIKRILDKLSGSSSQTVKKNIARVKIINEEYQYPSLKYRPPAGYYPAPYLQHPGKGYR